MGSGGQRPWELVELQVKGPSTAHSAALAVRPAANQVARTAWKATKRLSKLAARAEWASRHASPKTRNRR